MRRHVTRASLILSVAAATSIPFEGEAEACGGCFVQQVENTQVSGHRMILSVSPTETTLWDQITYDGSPESFAWVLPIKGVVDIGLSSDALFENLEARTKVDVLSPQLNCGNFAATDSAFAGPTAVAEESGAKDVTILAQEVVGPYETVQLSAKDPQALGEWLATNGYSIPEDVAPVVAAYVAEGFDFLALKLVPGEGIQSMRPVRVTTPGGSPILPLRMVAAGTGAITPITLWVFGSGRFAPANFPSFVLSESAIVWDWDTSSSNYAALVQSRFDDTKGMGWQIEAAEPTSALDLMSTISILAENQPVESGYADADGNGAPQSAKDDLAALIGALDPGSLWVTRMHARLPREALGTDLALWAAAEQVAVDRTLIATKTSGTPPCTPFPSNAGPDEGARKEDTGCGPPAAGPGARPTPEGQGQGEGQPGSDGQDDGERQFEASGGGGCAIASIDEDELPIGLAFVTAALGLALRRKRRPAR